MLLEIREVSKKPPGWIKQGIKLGNTFHYRRKNPIVHNIFNLSVLCLILSWVGGLVYLGSILTTWLYIPLGALGFGLSYFMLIILVVHEASHQMFIILKNSKRARVWNRLFGWLVCIPFGINYSQHWEIGHLIHHSYPVEPQDPQNCPETIHTGATLWRYLTKVMLVPGYALLRPGSTCPTAKPYSQDWTLTAGAAISIITIGLLEIYCCHWTVAVAAILGIQILVALNILKIAMEHGGDVGKRDYYFLRSCSSFFPFRKIFMPLNITLHFEHHLNCSVPWYDLLRYHNNLQEIVPDEFKSLLFKSNIAVWKQINQ
ncbi:MAG: fatty acid desaturase [Cyanobacteria bacterium P01_C01_bin.118]